MNGFVGWTAALLIACASAVSAQETTGTITGRIVDAQGLAVPGVTVTVTGPQGTKTAVTDNDGRFTIPFLAPGTYRIQTDLPGFKPVVRENVQVRLGQTADVTFVIEVGGVNETVQVVGNAAVVDPTSTTIGANFDTTTLSRLPVGRRFSDTLYLAPGVSSSGTAGSANPSVSGASGLENQYVVDGVNITNGGYGALGSYSIVFGSLGNGTPFDFMQEVQIKTGGYEAEFGQATGGVINVVTKTGTNSLRGSLFGYARPSKLESAYDQVKSVNGTVNTVGAHVSDAGATIGGPIRHDRLFFFGAIDPQRETRTVVAPSGFALASLGEVNRERRVLNYAAKGTWQITDTRRVNASFFGDPAHGLMGPQRGDALLKTSTSGFSELTMYGGHNQTVHYDDVLSPRFLLEASIGRALNRIQETPSVDAWFVTDRTVVPNVTSGGIGFYEAGNRSNNWQYEAKATNILSGYGENGIKYGIDVENLTYDQINQRTGPTFLAPNGQQTATGATIQILPDPLFGKIYRVTRANLNAARTTKQTYTSFFVQDTWRVTDRLTLRPGVRYEREHLTGTLADLPFSNNWAPRVGAAFDPRGDGRGKVFASYGRYYARVPNDLAARALSADAGIGADYFDAGLTRPIPNGVPAGPGGTTTHFSIAGAGADVIDPNAKLSYYNEYIVHRLRSDRRTQCRRAVRTPRHRARARGRAAVPDRRRGPGSSGRRQRRLPADQSGSRHADIGRPRRDVRIARPQLQRDRAHRQQAADEQLVAAHLVPLLAAARDVRRVLSRRQRPVGSGHHVAVRLPDQRSELYGDRRAAIRLQGRHSLPRRSRIGPAAARSAASTEAVRHLCVSNRRERVARHRRELGQTTDGARRESESELSERRRDSADAARHRVRDERRVPRSHAVHDDRERSGVL